MVEKDDEKALDKEKKKKVKIDMASDLKNKKGFLANLKDEEQNVDLLEITRPRVSENDVLYWEGEEKIRIPRSSMPPNDVEAIISFLTVPKIAIPLVLDYLAEDRAEHLISHGLRMLLDGALYESGPHASFSQDVSVENIPHNGPLPTTYGALFHELCKDPVPILNAALRLSYGAAQQCVTDFRTSFVSVLLYIIKLVINIINFCDVIEEHHMHRENTELRRMCKLLLTVPATATATCNSHCFTHFQHVFRQQY